MEPFSLLKFWRNAGTDADGDSLNSPTNNTNFDVRNRAPETDVESDEDDDTNDNDEDSDSFFDLVFTAPDCYNKQVKNAKCDSSKVDERQDSINNLIELESSPSLLKSKVFPVDSNSKPQSPISLLKSAPKFRVFLLGLRRSKSDKPETNEASKATTPKHQFKKSSDNQQSKRFTVKCKVEEVPIGSLFSRDNSLRSKLQRERSFDFSIDDSSKPLPKEDVPMYLKLIKPLYIRASRRYTDKTKFPSDLFSTVSPLSSPATVPSSSPTRKLSDERRGNRGAGFRAVSKHLGKSRSASSTVGMTSSPATNRRDDSLLLHNDGIQSAILHCKRSYNSPAKECSALLRSCHGISTNPAAGNLCSEQRNRCSSI